MRCKYSTNISGVSLSCYIVKLNFSAAPFHSFTYFPRLLFKINFSSFFFLLSRLMDDSCSFTCMVFFSFTFDISSSLSIRVINIFMYNFIMWVANEDKYEFLIWDLFWRDSYKQELFGNDVQLWKSINE